MVVPGLNDRTFAGLPVAAGLEDMAPFDAVMVTDISAPQAAYDMLRQRQGEDASQYHDDHFTWPRHRLRGSPINVTGSPRITARTIWRLGRFVKAKGHVPLGATSASPVGGRNERGRYARLNRPTA